MPVNQTLASFSDTAFITAFFIYLLALVISIFHYVKRSGIIDFRRERERAAERELVSIGAGADAVDSGTTGTADGKAVPTLADLPSEEELDAREAKADK